MTAQTITNIISGWNAAIATIGVLGVTLYASGFRTRAGCLIDTNNVLRIRIVNWGRLEGDLDSIVVVDRTNKEDVLAIIKPPKDPRMKSGSVCYRWARLELDGVEVKDVRVRILTASGRPRLRKVKRLDGPFYDLPGKLQTP